MSKTTYGPYHKTKACLNDECEWVPNYALDATTYRGYEVCPECGEDTVEVVARCIFSESETTVNVRKWFRTVEETHEVKEYIGIDVKRSI